MSTRRAFRGARRAENIERDPNLKQKTTLGMDNRDKIMKETNDEDKTEQSNTIGHSRRDFIVSAAGAVAGVGAVNLLNLHPAQGANATMHLRSAVAPTPLKVWRLILRRVPTSA